MKNIERLNINTNLERFGSAIFTPITCERVNTRTITTVVPNDIFNTFFFPFKKRNKAIPHEAMAEIIETIL